MEKAKKSLYYSLKINRCFERQSEDDSTDEEKERKKKEDKEKREENLKKLEDLQRVKEEYQAQKRQYEEELNVKGDNDQDDKSESEDETEKEEKEGEEEGTEEGEDLSKAIDENEDEDAIPEDLSQYIHNCRGEFQTIVYRRGREWLKIFGSEITKTTIHEAMDRDKWGDGEWTPLLLLYKQISFPPLKP